MSDMPVPHQSDSCCYEGCKLAAASRVWTKTGWANMCASHGAMYSLAKAKEYTGALGLKTIAEMRDWIRSKQIGGGKHAMHGEFKRKLEGPQRQREPGDDDDVVAA